MRQATDLFECRPEGYGAEMDSGGIFFDPVQRATFPLGPVSNEWRKSRGHNGESNIRVEIFFAGGVEEEKVLANLFLGQSIGRLPVMSGQ